MNLVSNNQFKWPEGSDFIEFMDEFKDMCLSIIHGAIDVMHIHVVFLFDYYSKSKCYSIQIQTIVDHCKRFWDVIFVIFALSMMLESLDFFPYTTNPLKATKGNLFVVDTRQ